MTDKAAVILHDIVYEVCPRETSILGREHVADLISSGERRDLPDPVGGHNVDLGSVVDLVVVASSLAANFITIYLFLNMKEGRAPSANEILDEAKGMSGLTIEDQQLAERVSEAVASREINQTSGPFLYL